MTQWILWSLLLIVQNAAFTLVSRARNSKSLFYHAWSSVLSNGIWFISQFILIDQMFKVLTSGTWTEAIPLGVIYVASTMTGSLGMHWIALNKIEHDKST